MQAHALVLLGLALALLLPDCSWGQLTDAEKREALDFTNHLRRNVVPKAGDMNGVFWDESLAKLAQDAADKCVFQHNYDGAYAKLGENVYRGGRRNMSEIFMFMFLERENFDYKTGACNINSGSKYPMFSTCGHYLQLAAANVVRMGCGIKKCPDGNNLAFCEYNRGIVTPPYEAGEPGTKCHNSMATYTQNGLCYYKEIGGTAPISGQLDCNVTCLNYGKKLSTSDMCMCICQNGFTGSRCEQKFGTSTVPNDCTAQMVTCKNGGVPTINADQVCKCVCPDNFRGDACEENIAQTDSSVFWYFGEVMIYSSYYPVDPQIWTKKYVQGTMQYYLTTELNKYCKEKYAECCPGGGSATSSSDIVGYGDLQITDNYPQNVLDGSLKIGLYYRLAAATATACGGSSAPYMNRNALLAASASANSSISNFLVYMGVKTIKFE